MSSSYLITVVVCTYNRSELLQVCLDSLACQIVAKDKPVFEVIIVDNNSTDATMDVACIFVEKYSHFRVVIEKQQGLSHARNCGWQEAQGQYVAYIDDDAKAYDDWIESIIAFTIQYPSVSVFGGPYFAYSVVPVPAWFPKDYGALSNGADTRSLRQDEWISGTNMIFRKSLLAQFGGFETELGMAGEVIAYGEETDLLQRMKDRKISIFYVPSVCVNHVIMAHKLNLYFLVKSSFARGMGTAKILNHSPSVCKKLFSLMIVCLKFPYTFTMCNERYIKTRLYRALAPVASRLGAFLFTMRC